MAKKLMKNYPLGVATIPVTMVKFSRVTFANHPSIGLTGHAHMFNVRRSINTLPWFSRPNSFINGRPRTRSANHLSRFI